MIKNHHIINRVFLSFGLSLLVGLAQTAKAASTLEEVRMWRAPDHTRLVFDLSEQVEYKLFTLENPRRVVIDIDNTTQVDDLSGLDFTGSPIDSVRSGVRSGTNLRVVLDLNTEVKPSSFTLEPNSEHSDRLVVDLYDVEGAAPTPSTASPVSGSSNRAPTSTSDQRRDIVVAISAGHGGEDPGSISPNGKLKEKTVTLAISKALRDSINAMPGYRAIMIRESDYYVELKRRPQIARENRADLFVAVHADWYKNSLAKGVTVYALSGDRADRENARRVVEKENSSDLLGGVGGDIALGGLDDDVALTLVSLQMAWSMEQSLVAGTQIIESLEGIARLRKTKVQQASLQVLNSPDIPSMLIETGYLTNPEDARQLSNPAFQRKMAAAMAKGVRNYFYDSPPEGSLVAWQKANGVVPSSYTVKRGDSLSVIAARFGVSMAQLKSENRLSSNTIRIGQELTIPGAGSGSVAEHRIARGETLSEIAARYRVSLAQLRIANDISGDRIMVGQVLKIPTI
ncbi:MAG: N-acetylmuramoyl-L-alanine amidase [Pseudohongiellaceae bacterium]